MMPGGQLALSEVMGRGADPAARLAESLAAAAAVGSLGHEIRELPGIARGVAVEKVSDAIAAIAGTDVRDMLVGGWRIHQKLRRAAQETAARPDAERTVELIGHRVRWTDRPTVEVYLDGVRLATLHVEFVASLAVDAMHATVRGGSLVSVDLGEVVAHISVAIERHTWRSPSFRLDLPGSIPLGDGIDLVDRPPRAPV